MDLLLIVAGVVLIVVVFIDALATTLSVASKDGWLTRSLTRTLWAGLMAVSRGGAIPSVLRPAGVLMLTSTVLMWVLLLWAGTSLVLLGGDPSVIDSTSRAPASAAQVIYFAGFTVFTLGVGDFVATTDTWRLFTAAMSFLGLALVTLSITYLLNVVSAVVNRRSLAVHVHSLGGTPGEVVAVGWDGSQFSSPFQQHLVALASEIATVAEQHLAYPVLDSFHSGDRATAAPVALAVLDEAMLLLDAAVAPDVRPQATATGPVRYALGRYMDASSGVTRRRVEADPPPVPDTTPLTAAGVPLADAAEIDRAFDRSSGRRARLHRMVRSRGWSWTPA